MMSGVLPARTAFSIEGINENERTYSIVLSNVPFLFLDMVEGVELMKVNNCAK